MNELGEVDLDIVPISRKMNIPICKVCDELVEDPWPHFNVQNVCLWPEGHPICTVCKDPIIKNRWNGSKCLDCHEDSLLPETPEDRLNDDLWESEDPWG